MSDSLSKLRPDRDLQCYFLQPSAVAALSDASQAGFALSGSWRQQFDWAVVEWSRDNVFEHPALRNLPDGDLSSIRLSYEENRSNCIPIDSTLFPTVDWPYLRLWVEEGAAEALYRVPLKQHATAMDEAVPATVEFELGGTINAGDYIELAWQEHHFNYFVLGGDTLEVAAGGLAAAITANQAAGQVSATANGPIITLTWLGSPGSNGNRIGVYGTVSGARTETWSPAAAAFGGGSSGNRWRVELDFGNLVGYRDADLTTLVPVPTGNVRKMRWTWAADFQQGAFARSEFAVQVQQWSVVGGGVGSCVAGAGSRRIENDSDDVSYTGAWIAERGNYSGGSIHHSVTHGDSMQCTYSAPLEHTLYVGTRYVGPDRPWKQNLKYEVTVQVDSARPLVINLRRDTEDVLIRYPLGQFSGNVNHTVNLTNSGDSGADVYFDFLEAAVPSSELPDPQPDAKTTLATDWDTEHSLAIAPERTAWLIDKLGFRGRANHYAGALWFYELCRPGHTYASATITFSGTTEFGKVTTVWLANTPIAHLTLIGDTPESVATAIALLINSGWTSAWAQAEGAALTISARAMGTEGNKIAIAADTGGSSTFHCTVSGTHLTGGTDAPWLTDGAVTPRLNRAARDWTRSFVRALNGRGIAMTAAFSTELGNGDDSAASGIAQRYPDGSAVWVNTPALQTNFSPESLAFWQQVYLDMATVMAEAGVTPYLQFGEVQWWYFAGPSGMTFYDAYTKAAVQSRSGRPLPVITTEQANPAPFADQCAVLRELIGEFTAAIMAYVRQAYPQAKFEVLYPPDTNDTPLNRAINFPAEHWTPATLTCLKTENFTYTGDRNLDKARESISVPEQHGFGPSQSSHLVGIGDTTTPWAKERSLALAAGVESVVLFALDQLCLVGHELPDLHGIRSARLQG